MSSSRLLDNNNIFTPRLPSKMVRFADEVKKMVRFAPTSQLILYTVDTNHLENTTWYTEEELDGFKYRQAKTIRRLQMVAGQASKANDLNAAHVIGLEKHLTEDIETEYITRRRNALKMVLRIQKWQRKEGFYGTDLGVDIMTKAIREQSSMWAQRQAEKIATFHLHREFHQLPKRRSVAGRCA